MSTNEPFFSIILPTYNRASRIQKAIQSALTQTYADFELVIVDDGSTDNTSDIVKGFGDDRIKYFFKQNEERSIARNFGISKCRGKYINFLDSDDYFYPHHLATAHNRLAGDNSPMALHMGFEIRDDSGKLLYEKHLFAKDVNQKLILENTFLANSFFIKREVFSEIHFLNSRDAVISEDWYLWLRLAARHAIAIENTITNVVVEHKERSLNNLDASKVEESISIILEDLRKDERVVEFYSDQFNFFAARNWCFIALCFAMKGNRIKTRLYLQRARKEYPRIVFTKNYLAVLRKYLRLFF